MNQRKRAIEYFSLRCGFDEFWKWCPNSGGVLWTDGSLVASREELVAVLQRLECNGLPPFGAVVQLLAGCRDRKIVFHWQKPKEDTQDCPEEKRRLLRYPCGMESGGKARFQRQRVRMFGTPESISAAAERLSQLPMELEGMLDHPRALPELAHLLLSGVEKAYNTEDVIRPFAEGQFTGTELNSPSWYSKYPTVLEDLALLSPSFGALPASVLRARLKASLDGEALNQ